MAFTGEIFLAHLRYGTFGKNQVENCHPFLRQNNWRTRNLVVAGNFNMTNTDELFDKLVGLGQHPKEKADTVTILERLVILSTSKTSGSSINTSKKASTTRTFLNESPTRSTCPPC